MCENCKVGIIIQIILTNHLTKSIKQMTKNYFRRFVWSFLALLGVTVSALAVKGVVGNSLQANEAERTVLYSWEGNADGAIESGGTATATDNTGADLTADDINMVNSTYNVIRLRGAKDFSTYVINVALDKELKAGDSIAITGYRNKNAADKQSGALIKFEKGSTTASTGSTGLEFVNIDQSDASAADQNRGTEPNTVKVLVPESAEGSKSFTMTRAVTATNLFITKIEVISYRDADAAGGEEGGIQEGGSSEKSSFRDFAVNIYDGTIFNTSVMSHGVKVATDGSYSDTSADDADAIFSWTAARYSDAQHGWVNCEFTVPVDGPVKVELGDCAFGAQNGTIVDTNGNTTEIKANASKACWSATNGKVVTAYYGGTEKTTLTITYNGYCPFIAVTAVDASEIPNEATLTFDAARSGAEGTAPVQQKVTVGEQVTIPANTTLYIEGKTLKGWTDGTSTYAAGDKVTVNEDITLTPVFADNAVSFADRTDETTVTWQFGEGSGVGPINAEGKSTIVVAQATIGEAKIDVKMDVDATNGKLNNVGRGDKWAQCNDGTKMTIPAYKGMTVSFDSNGDGASTTIAGATATDKTGTYNGTGSTIDIVAGGMGYIASVTATYPVPDSEGGNDEPVEVQVAYAAGSETFEGDLLPAGGKYNAGDIYTIPANNFTLYKEGYTLTGWTDGTDVYGLGEKITLPAQDVTLTPVFTENEVSLNDREEPVTLVFDFQRQNGAPTVAWENKAGIVWVTQATVKGKTIDVKADVSTSPGKFANGNWTDWAQLNAGTTFSIPNYKGAKVSIESYSATTTTTIDGQTDYATSGNVVSYDVANTAEAIDIVIGDGSFFRYIKTILPVPEKAFVPVTYTNEEVAVRWPFESHATISDYTVSLDDAISVASVSVTGLSTNSKLSGVNTSIGSRSQEPDNGMAFLTFAGNSEFKMNWNVKPTAGLTFTPTQIRMYVQRFGTNKENGVVVSAAVEGASSATTLGTYTARRANWTTEQEISQFKWAAAPATLVNEVVINLTEEQQHAFTSSEGFNVYAVTGLGDDKFGGFADIRIYGVVNGTTEDVTKYTLAANVNDDAAGTVSIYPAAEDYEQGTEVRLTATENFGYDFVNWTNAAGEEVSSEPVFTLAMTADSVLTANFVQVKTYELKLNVDGANDYMVKVSPAPTVVDGKNMYEEGTGVQLTAESYEGLVAFNNWNDGQTNSNKTILMNKDQEYTAFYADNDIIAGWDFYKAGASGRKADFADADNETATLTLVNTSDNSDVQGWLDKSTIAANGYESFKGAAVNWRVGSSAGDVGNYHWQTKINAQNYTDINVQFQMMYNFNAYQKYLAEYSLDGEEWTKFDSITMTKAKVAASFSAKLPAAANNQANVYIRMRADKTSVVDGTASANDGNALAMFFITGTAKIVDDGVAPKLVSQVPANGAEGASATGKIVLTFNEKVKVADGTVALLNGMELTPVVSGKSVTFEYKGLEYSTSYEFTLPANTVADLTDNYLAEAVTINFTTMTRPTVVKQLYDFVVPEDGTFKEALNAAATRADKSKRYRIFVKKGSYVIPANQDNLVTGSDGKQYADPKTYFNSPNVSIIGEDRDATSIANEMPNSLTDNAVAGSGGQANPLEGIRTSGVLYLQSGCTDTYFQDIKLLSPTADATGRNVVLVDGGNRTVCKNVTLWAYQDTYVPDNSQNLYYFEDGIVRGRTDFVCGSGDVFFNSVNFIMCEAGGYLSVPRDNVKYGFVYKDCTIDGNSGVDGNYYLGRAWTAAAESYFIDTKMNVVPKGEGWDDWNNGPTRFAEYNSMTSSGLQIDLSSRKTSFPSDSSTNKPILTAEEALEIGNLHNMFGDWDPTLLTEQAPLVKNVVLDGNTITWDDSDYALLYAVVKNGSVVAFTTENSFDISTVDTSAGAKAGFAGANAADTWAVRAANEMGGLNEAVLATEATAVSEVEAATVKAVANGKVYNVAGQEVSDSYKGIVIIDGKKIVK